MDFLKRLLYYLIGMSLGCALLFAFFGDRYMSCAYFPNARVLQHLNAREIRYDEQALRQMSSLKLDSAYIRALLHHGHVDFSRSKPRAKPCKTYRVAGDSIYVQIQSCEGDQLATICEVAQRRPSR